MELERTSTRPAPHTRGALLDQFGRTFNYLRIAVTENCNLRCVYCMPEEGVAFTKNDELLTNAELLRIVRVVADLGVDKIRFTGGEPLVRKDFVELAAMTAATPGIDTVHVTTNGILLPRVDAALRAAGIHGLNISLDTLDEKKFERITRRTGLREVRRSVERAVELGFPSVKVNVVMMRGFNDDEFVAFAEMTRAAPITVRFIELMPFDSHQIWKTGRFFGAPWMIERLRTAFPGLRDVSGSKTEQHVFRVDGFTGKVAVIPSYTRTLCGDCNRVRLTADGRIRNCLYAEDEFDVRAVLRGGGSDEELAAVFKEAMWQKRRDGWESQKAARERRDGHHRDSMTMIGG
jgi:cyclic pyranopterin phosphate synthase